jgi:hypothetical protein
MLLRSIDEFINLQYEIDGDVTCEEFIERKFLNSKNINVKINRVVSA